MPGVIDHVSFNVTNAGIGGTQDITIPGFGTPQAAMFIIGRPQSMNTNDGDRTIGVGITDGVTHYFVSSFAQNAQTSTQAYRYQNENSVLALLGRFRSTQGVWDFDSWITDGVRISVNQGGGELPLCTAIFFKGFEYAVVKHHTLPSNAASSLVLTGNSGAPDIGFYLWSDFPTGWGTTGPEKFSFGVAVDEGGASLNQRAVADQSIDGGSTSSCWQYISNTHAIAGGTNGVLDFELAIDDYTVDGSGDGQIDFPVNNSFTASDIVGVLALKSAPGDQFKLIDTVVTTGAGYDENGVGFASDFGLLMCGQGWTSNDQDINAGNLVSWGFSTFNDTEGWTVSVNDQDNLTTTIARTGYSNRFEFMDVGGTFDCRGNTIPQIDANGWSLTWFTAPSADRYGWAFAFASGGGVPLQVAFSDINVALSRPAGQELNIDDPAARTLAGAGPAGTEISLSEFQGKV